MKKGIVILMASGMLWVSGCGGNSEKVIEGKVQNVVTGSESVQSVESEAAEIQTADEQKDDNASSTDTKGYVFTFGETVVEVDADAANVIEKLGEPISYFEAPSCAFEGLDKIYTYNSFEIDTYPAGDMDHISAIIFKDDSVLTTEGIGIGDSMEKLEQTYGSDFVREGGMIVYSKDDMKLCFILQEDAIISIEYRSTVLE